MAIVINGTTGITDVNGTAAAPAITGTDTDSGMYFGTNIVALATAGTNAVYIDASQNVGLGTTSPNQKLQVNNTAASSSFALFTNSTTGSTASDGTYFGINSSGFAYAWNQENTAMLFGTNNGERMRITATGDIGIGTDSPNTKLQVYKAAASAFTGTSPGALLVTDSTNTTNYFTSIDFNTTTSPSVPFARIGMGYTASGSTLNFGTSNSYASGITNTAMTIDPVGNLLVGTASPLISSARRGLSVLAPTGTFVAAAFANDGGASAETVDIWNKATTGDNVFISFDTEATFTERGSISYNRAGGLTNYGVTSDYRSKTVNGPVINALSKLSLLKPSTGRMNGATQDIDFFVAHELQEVVPSAVIGEKDAVNEDNTPKYQMVDKSAIIPLLTAAIQEQQALITSLTARIEALEAR